MHYAEKQGLDKTKEKKFLSNLNGLDLNLSQTRRIENAFKPKQDSPEQVKKLMERGDMIDSLDLNIGYESIQKLQENWGGAFRKTKRDPEDFKAFKPVPVKSKAFEYEEKKTELELTSKKKKVIDEDPDFDRTEDDSLEEEMKPDLL